MNGVYLCARESVEANEGANDPARGVVPDKEETAEGTAEFPVMVT